MTLVADGLLIAGAFAAAFYCWILSARVKSLKDLDKGLGAAIASLSGKVDEMQNALKQTQKVAGTTQSGISDVTARAERVAEELSQLLEQIEADARRPQRASQAEDRPATMQARRASGRIADDEPPPSQRGGAQSVPHRQPLRVAELPTERDEALSNAQRLQKEIRDKLTDGGRDGDADDLVKTIQSLLVAARQ